MAEPIRIGLVFPQLLGTYGDRGNAEVLAWRLRRRRHPAQVVELPAPGAIPAGLDAYMLGGGEDLNQAAAVKLLLGQQGRGLRVALAGGAPALAVCGSLQLLGTTYLDAAGRRVPGLHLLDLETVATGARCVGEVVARLPDGRLLTGFENHGGRTRLGGTAEPLHRPAWPRQQRRRRHRGHPEGEPGRHLPARTGAGTQPGACRRAGDGRAEAPRGRGRAGADRPGPWPGPARRAAAGRRLRAARRWRAARDPQMATPAPWKQALASAVEPGAGLGDRLVEALAAGAGALGVGVVDREAGLLERVKVVDLGAAEVRRAHPVGHDLDAGGLAADVAVERPVVEEQGVAKTGATARLDRDSQGKVLTPLAGEQVADLDGRSLGQAEDRCDGLRGLGHLAPFTSRQTRRSSIGSASNLDDSA